MEKREKELPEKMRKIYINKFSILQSTCQFFKQSKNRHSWLKAFHYVYKFLFHLHHRDRCCFSVVPAWLAIFYEIARACCCGWFYNRIIRNVQKYGNLNSYCEALE